MNAVQESEAHNDRLLAENNRLRLQNEKHTHALANLQEALDTLQQTNDIAKDRLGQFTRVWEEVVTMVSVDAVLNT